MDELKTEFAFSLAATARADLEGAFDRAAKQAGPGRALRALVALRERADEALRNAAEGRGTRMPADIVAEALGDIHSILHPEAIAKRAGAPGTRDAALTNEEVVRECIAIGAGLAALFDKWRPVFRTLNAETDLARWRRRHGELLDQLFRVRDIASARAEMVRATETLMALYDDVRIRNALPPVTSPTTDHRRARG